MRIKGMVRRLAVSVAAVAAMTGGVVAVTAAPAQAYATVCKTVYLGSANITAIQPYMYVPICYNGSAIWQNGGGITPGVNGYGYTIHNMSWYGTYNGGGNWLGAGINYRATIWGGWASFSCNSRWTLNAHGQQTWFDRGC